MSNKQQATVSIVSAKKSGVIRLTAAGKTALKADQDQLSFSESFIIMLDSESGNLVMMEVLEEGKTPKPPLELRSNYVREIISPEGDVIWSAE